MIGIHTSLGGRNPLRNLIFETGRGQILRLLLSNCYSTPIQRLHEIEIQKYIDCV
jgi:hypothetical protein